MYYMNRTKRNLIIASAIVNLCTVIASLVLSVLLMVIPETMQNYADLYYAVGYSSSIYYTIFSFVAGLVGSIFLLFSVREKGKCFRTSQGLYIAGIVIIIVCGSFLSWILLFISMFIPNVVVMNSKSELRQEEKMESKEQQAQNEAYDDKKRQIEDLKRLRDNGVISEEEYKEKLFELL